MRIRGAKTELEEAGLETDGMVESTATLRAEIEALSGVDIMEADGKTFKSTYAILDELAKKWKDLSDIQQATITELIAGKRQGNVISSLMQNFNVAREALETSLNSSGSAMKEHEKWQKSLEARLNKLKSAWQGLSQAFMKSDFLKGALDAIIGLVDGLTKLIDTIGVLPTLLTGFTIFKSFTGKGFFKVIEDEAAASGKRITSVFGQAFAAIKQTFSKSFSFGAGFETSLNSDVAAINNYIAKIREGVPAEEAFAQTMREASAEAQHFARNMNTATMSASQFETITRQSAITEQAASFRNARSLINEYNTGLKTCGLNQEQFLDAVGKSNTHFAKYLSSVGQGNATMRGYIISLVGAKAATIGLQIATTALNAVIGMGIGALVSVVISGITKWINAEKNLAEEIEEVTAKFEQQHKELQKLKGDLNTDNESSMISRYAKLSKGVDNLGQNLSLTSDEYSEYLSLVDKIADTFPALVNGYDSQGNAILECKDNVAALTAEYERLIETNADTVLNENLSKIADDFSNKLDDSAGQSFGESAASFGSTVVNAFGGLFGLSWVPEIELTSTALQSIKYMLAAKDKGKEAINEAIKDSTKYSDALHDYEAQIITALRGQGVDIDSLNYEEKLAEIIEQNPAKLQAIIDKYEGDMEAFASSMKAISTATLTKAFDISGSDYYGMSDTLKNVVYSIVNGFDADFYEKYKTNPEGIIDYIHGILDQLKAIDDEGSVDIEAAFDLKTQFNGGDIPYGDYVKGLEDTGKTIDKLVSDGKLDKEIGTQLKLSIGLDENGLVDEYQRLTKRLTSDKFNISTEDYESFVNDLSAEELSVVWDVIAKFEKTDIKETIADFESALKLEMMKAGLTFDLNLEVETAGIDALNTALAESVSATGLSSESITALKGRYADLEAKGYDLSALFEETSHGIHLNRQEFNKLEKAYATDKLADVNSDLEEMKVAYDDLGKAIKDTDDPVRKAELYNDRQTLAKRISEAATLAAQYEGLTSAYNDWLAAEEAGQERDMYENVIEGFENIGDEISRGWYDDGTIEFLEMLTGRTDLAGKSAKQLKEIYDGLDKSIKYIGEDGKVLEDTGYSVRDFFTVDDEGNATADGVYNFLDAIGKLEEEAFGGKDIVKRDKNGKPISFDFELAGGDEAIADALGVSKELVQIMKRAADDAGFVVSLDGTYKQLADLQNEARESAEYLKSIGKTDFNFDFNTTSLTSLNKQLAESKKILEDKDFWNKDGTFNFNADGATEAMQIVSTLQAKIDNLTEEKYGIGLTVEDEEFEEPLENLQEYGRTIQTLNQLKLNPKANADEIKELEGDLKEISEYFANLDGETKVKLGLDADDNWEEVKTKIEKGEVKIPTVLDIQANMDKNIETLADLALLGSGLLSEDEEEAIVKKYKIEAKADEVDTSDVEDKVETAVVDGLGNPILSRETNIEIIAETFGIEDVDGLSSKLEGLDDKTVQAIAEAVGKGDVDALQIAVEGMDGNTVQAVAEALGYSNVEELKAAVRNMQGNEVDAKVNTDGQAEKVSTLQDTINSLKGKTVDIVINTIKKVVSVGAGLGADVLRRRFGIGGANGTANVDGTAFANGSTGRAYKRGSWGTKNSGTALVGELGREILVRDGRYYTIGDNGAEFIKYKKGDIIFNHKQTEELFENGKVTSGGGRAKAFAQGTAFDTGTGGGEYGGSTVGSNDKDKFEETFDWIDILLSRLERTIDNLDKTVNNTYKSWTQRNTALASEITKVGDLIDNIGSKDDPNSIAGKYWAKADAVGLDEDYAAKIRNGTLNIENFEGKSDEALVEKIKEYQKWYELYLDIIDKAEDLKQTEAELWAQRFDNVQAQYDGILQGFEHTESMLNEYISQAEAKGHVVSKNYYQALIDNERNNIAELKKEQSDLIAKRDEAVASGVIVKGSQAWYDMCAEIDGVTQAIEEGNTSLIEYANSMRDIDWQVFDLIQERISDVTEEANFLIDLMSYDKLFDDSGKLTDKGMATMGLHAQNYNTHMYQADTYADEIEKLNQQIDALGENDYDLNLINRRNELLELQRESILAAEDEKQAIKDLVEEGINLELDALQERIDLYNEELDSMKDLYDYQKNVEEQTKNIASLQKQLRAYEGFDDEETRATVQKLKVELESAQKDLEETEYDKFISDQSALLDELYLEYETTLNERLDDLNGLITESFAAVNDKADIINATIDSVAGNVGVEMSEELSNIWSGESGIEGVVREYGDGFNTSLTSVVTTLGTIKDGVNTLVGKSDTKAETKVEAPKTNTSAISNPAGGSGGGSKPSSSSSGGNKSTGDGNAKIGDKVKFLSGKYYYDSQGVNPAGSKNHGKQVYITNVNKKSWATHPYHISTGKKLGQGDLGWLKLNQLSGYATGKKNFVNDEIAWTQEKGQEFIVRPSDGAILTPIARKGSVLNAQASENLWNMTNSPAEFIKDNLNLGATNVPDNSNIQSSYTQYLDKVVFNLPNVHSYNELLSEMQKDKNFERLILSMTINQIAGGSSLAKGKSIRK